MKAAQTQRSVPLNVSLPIDLRKRAHIVAKRHQTSTNQLIRDALYAKVVEIEQRDQEYDKRLQADKLEKRMAVRGIPLIGASPLAPTAIKVEKDPEEPITAPVVPSESRTVYTDHAKKIFDVLEAPMEKRIRIAEALKAIKDAAPLTHPGDAVIMANLEQLVLALRAAQPQPSILKTTEKVRPMTVGRVVDELVGVALDLDKTKSYGDIGSDPE